MRLETTDKHEIYTDVESLLKKFFGDFNLPQESSNKIYTIKLQTQYLRVLRLIVDATYRVPASVGQLVTCKTTLWNTNPIQWIIFVLL
jgi:hypothetical protein